jgi:hypothetical protein
VEKMVSECVCVESKNKEKSALKVKETETSLLISLSLCCSQLSTEPSVVLQELSLCNVNVNRMLSRERERAKERTTIFPKVTLSSLSLFLF